MTKFKKLLLSLLLIASGVVALSVAAPKAHALSGSDFNPGRIIDDSVFFNKDAMSVNDIQNFLYAKSGPCDTNRATTDSRYQPPWTCLYQYRENTSTHANNLGSPGSNPAGSITGAQIIYDAAQQYNISPKALIVLIQKESSLITDNWPWSNQYRTATGYGCPDTAPCDAQYYGFYNQVNKAAFQFRRYANYPNEYNYKAGRNNNIGYNPNAACGTQTVYIQNQATAGLYNYTPYVPNAAALNNLYGTGDGCSAYGNRNFWRLYSDWFGSTQGVAYSATYAGQSVYPNIAPGGSSAAYISYKNTGANAWYDDTSRSSGPSGTLPTRLATGNPTNRASDFGSSWTSDKNRPALNFSAVYESDGTTLAANQHVVQPGQIGKFGFTFNVPTSQAVGLYREYFRPVLDGSSDGAFTYDTVWLDVTVSGTYGSAWSSQGSSPAIHPTESYGTYIAYKNTGNIPWFDDLSIYGAPSGTKPVHLATSRTINRSSIFGATWGSDKNRPADVLGAVYESNGTTLAGNQHVVQPGQIGKFNINLQTAAGQGAGSFTEYFQPIVEGGTTMNDPDTYLAPSVSSLPSGASTVSPQTVGMTPGETKTYTTSFVNTGNSTWTPSTVFLQPDGANSTSQFKANNWISTTKVSALNQSSVAPGVTGTFSLSITAPAQAGSYAISFAPGNGTTSFGSPNAKFAVNVERPVYSATYAEQSAYPNMLAGDSAAAHVSYKNTGNVAWYDNTSRSSGPSGTLPTRLATGNPTNRASIFGSSWTSDQNRPALNFGAVYESDGTTLASSQHIVQPGQIGKFSFTFNTPANAGTGLYREFFRPVLDGSSDGAFTYDSVWLDVRVSQPVYSATFAGQSDYPTIARSGNSAAYISYKNSGNISWYDDISRPNAPVGSLPTRLATGNPTNRASAFGSSWTSDNNRPALVFGAVYEANGTTLAGDQHIVQPGQIAKFTFTFNVSSSQASGLYREFFRPVLDGSRDGAFSYDNVWLDLRVQ